MLYNPQDGPLIDNMGVPLAGHYRRLHAYAAATTSLAGDSHFDWGVRDGMSRWASVLDWDALIFSLSITTLRTTTSTHTNTGDPHKADKRWDGGALADAGGREENG